MENSLLFLVIVGFVAFLFVLTFKFYGLIYGTFGLPGVILFFMWSNRNRAIK